MKRRSLLIVVGAVTATSVACSLVYRPSDYFDPSDELTSVVVTADDATEIVLTSTMIIYATSNGIYALPKSGGDAQTLTTFSSGDLTALASNETDLVTWCGAMGLQTWRPGGPVTTIDSATDCTSVDAYGENISAALTSTSFGDGSTYQAFVYDAPSFALNDDAGTGIPAAQGNDRISLTQNSLYYATSSFVGRQPVASDNRTLKEPFCGLGVSGGSPRDFRVLDLTDGGVFVLYRASLGFRRFVSDGVCCKVNGDGGGESPCPDHPLDVNTTYHAIVVRGSYLYYLPDNELRRGSISDDPDASPALIRGGLNEVVGSLAVDDDYAYLGVSGRILKVALPH